MKKILAIGFILLLGCKETVYPDTNFEGTYNVSGANLGSLVNRSGKDKFTVRRPNSETIYISNDKTINVDGKRKIKGSDSETFEVNGSGTWFDSNLGKNIDVYYKGSVKLTNDNLEMTLLFTPNNSQATLLFTGNKVK